MVERKVRLLAVLATSAFLGGIAPAALAYNATSTDGPWTYWTDYDSDFTAETISYGSGGNCCSADAYLIKTLENTAPNTTNDYAHFAALLSSGPYPCNGSNVRFLVNGLVAATFSVCHSDLRWYDFEGSNWPIQRPTNSFTFTPSYGVVAIGVDSDNDFGRSYNSQYGDVPGEFVAYFDHGYNADLHRAPEEHGRCTISLVRTVPAPDLGVGAPRLDPLSLSAPHPVDAVTCGSNLDRV